MSELVYPSRLYPGPDPHRARLQEIDPKVAARGIAALVRFAQGRGERLPVGARELLTIVITAGEAARARKLLAAEKPVPVRCLAALAGVTPRYVHRLVRSGTLAREGRSVVAASAVRWLGRDQKARTVSAHRLNATPSWFRDRFNMGWVRMRLHAHARLMLPADCVMIEDARDDLVLLIPASAGMSREVADELRRKIRARFEELDPGPGVGWRTPPPPEGLDAGAV